MYQGNTTTDPVLAAFSYPLASTAGSAISSRTGARQLLVVVQGASLARQPVVIMYRALREGTAVAPRHGIRGEESVHTFVCGAHSVLAGAGQPFRPCRRARR